MNFSNDEINLMCIYNADTRKDTLAELEDMRGYLDTSETELLELTDSVISKLEQMSDVEFEELDLFPDFDE